MLMDHISVIAPTNRLTLGEGVITRLFNTADEIALKDAIHRMFHFNEAALTQDEKEITEADDYGYDTDESENELGGDVIIESGEYPLLWTLAVLDDQTRANDKNYPSLTQDPEFKKYADMFLSQLSDKLDKNYLVYTLSASSFLLSEGIGSEQFYSSNLIQIYKGHRINNFHLFCDYLLFHQLKELMIRQWTVPYHVNVRETMRWTYTAKETPMFMDLLVLDECRYVYDWMPTLDMLSMGVMNDERQLSFRFALDGVSKHKRWYNPEYFSGTAVIDQFTSPFEAQELLPRVRL